MAWLTDDGLVCRRFHGSQAFDCLEEALTEGRGGQAARRDSAAWLGHVRYATDGNDSIDNVHPFRYTDRQAYTDRHADLMLCGNFHFADDSCLAGTGQPTRAIADSVGRAVSAAGGDVAAGLKAALAPRDGGFVLCGLMADGTLFAVRDAGAIRPAYWYCSDSCVVVASERQAITHTLQVADSEVRPLPGGCVLTAVNGKVTFRQVLEQRTASHCAFEQIYFSSPDDSAVAAVRRRLGAGLARDNGIPHDSLVTYVPRSAREAALGLAQETGLELKELIVKERRMRNFIAPSGERDAECSAAFRLADSTPIDRSLLVVDDSIVRGTTLRYGILPMLAGLKPRSITVMSSAPQIRYPDCYGIDLSTFDQLVAFRAAVSVLVRNGRRDVLDRVYQSCCRETGMANPVTEIYDEAMRYDLNGEIARLLTPEGLDVPVTVVFQSVSGLHDALMDGTGDWNFTGRYPTPGGCRFVRQAYVEWYKRKFG